MTQIAPPFSLDDLPLTQAVWDALIAFQPPFRNAARLVRDTKVHARLNVTLFVGEKGGLERVERARARLSKHQEIHHLDTLQRLEETWGAIDKALLAHPVHGFGRNVLTLRAHGTAEIVAGSHSLQPAEIEWRAGNAAVAAPFLDRLAQHEKLSRVIPEGTLKEYAFVTCKGQSTHYMYHRGVDAAHAALKLLIGTKQAFFQGAVEYDPKYERGFNKLPRPGTVPQGEADWKDIALSRAEAAGIQLHSLPS